MVLDSKLNFKSHIREAILKARRGIGLLKYLSKYVSREVLDQIYKLYVRPHLDFGDIVYHKHDPDKPVNFTEQLEQTQYKAALTVSVAWKGTRLHIWSPPRLNTGPFAVSNSHQRRPLTYRKLQNYYVC